MKNIQLQTRPFDPWNELTKFQQSRFRGKTDIGATAVFVGTMRDFNEGENVQTMHLEHYPGMTEKYLGELVEKAKQDWPLEECLVIHRVGDIQPSEAIVLTAAWSGHRKEALEACRYLIEELKHNAPFWKKETLDSGEARWVEVNTQG